MLTRCLRSGLSGERSRWEASVNEYKEDIKHLTGDCALAAAFLGYAGPFPSQYRQQLVQECWMPAVQKSMLPVSDNFNFAKFLAVPTDVREWNIQVPVHSLLDVSSSAHSVL